MSSREQGRRHADRAAQFMPFAALTGYYDLVREKERVREPRRYPGEEDAERISGELMSARRGQLVRVTHYDGEAYVTRAGMVTSVEPELRRLTIARERIRFDDIWRVEVLER